MSKYTITITKHCDEDEAIRILESDPTAVCRDELGFVVVIQKAKRLIRSCEKQWYDLVESEI